MIEKEKITQVSEELMKRTESLFQELEIYGDDYCYDSGTIRGPAPCHGGNNTSGFVYYLFDGRWVCWTQNCHEEYHGDLIGLICAVKEVDFKRAIEIAEDFINGNEPDLNPIKKRQKDRIENKDIWKIHLNQIIYPEDCLKRLNTAEPYAKQRKISPRIFKRHGVGYAYRGQLHGRIVCPVRNYNGDIVGFSGRNIKQSGPKWKHNFKKNYNLFNIEKFKMSYDPTAILVEGPFDCMKIEMCGHDNCLAVFGTSINSGQIEVLKRSGITNIILAFDGDKAGINAAEKAARKLAKGLFSVKTIHPPEGKDWADLENDAVKELLGCQKY